MSIVQALIGSIASSGSGGGGGGTYPSPGGGTYQATLGSGYTNNGTAYNPGGAVFSVATASAGWLRKTTTGYWCNVGSQNNDNPDVFLDQNILSQTNDVYGGFGQIEGADAFAMEWTGYFRVPSTAAYWNFILDSDDVAMFWIGNAAYDPTAENAYVTSNNGNTIPTNSLLLSEGYWYPIRMRFQEWSGGERCQVFAAADLGTAYSMVSYFNNGDLLYNGVTGGYGSSAGLLLALGDTPYSGTGYWLDSSPALNHAELYGTSTLPTYLPDEAEGVWQLDGTQYFNVPTMAGYRDPTMTLHMWFNCASDIPGVSQNLASKELSFKLRITPGGVINIMAGNGTAPWVVNNSTSAGAFTYGVWNHIAVTIDANATVLYLNGQAIGTYSGTTIDATGDFPFNIGSHSYGSDNFTGKIGTVTVLSTIFDAGAIANEYTLTAPRYGITP